MDTNGRRMRDRKPWVLASPNPSFILVVAVRSRIPPIDRTWESVYDAICPRIDEREPAKIVGAVNPPTRLASNQACATCCSTRSLFERLFSHVLHLHSFQRNKSIGTGLFMHSTTSPVT